MREKEFKFLLEKYLRGRASEKEINLIKRFEKESELKSQSFDYGEPIEEIKDRIFGKIQKQLLPVESGWLKIAASFLIILGLGTLGMWFGANSNNHTFSNNSNQVKHIRFVDGTKVILNKGSQIQYDESTYNKKFREVQLEGEAFFKVARDADKPFVVSSGDISTTVLGTSFNVREEKESVTVTVVSGAVEVSDNNSEMSVSLLPNEQAKYSEGEKLKKKSTDYILYTTWLKDKVYLENISVRDFLEVLMTRFEVRVTNSRDSLLDQRISINLRRNDDLTTLINRFNYISKIHLKTNSDNEVTLTNKK